jgi:hypothetical protein
MNNYQQELNQLAMALRDPGQLDQPKRDEMAHHIDTLSLVHGMLSDKEWNADLYDRVSQLFLRSQIPLYPMDSELDAEQLADKYGTATSWGKHPKFSRSDWQHEVAAGDTQSGYWEWVYNRIQNGYDDE